jgi:hypothetical protein
LARAVDKAADNEDGWQNEWQNGWLAGGMWVERLGGRLTRGLFGQAVERKVAKAHGKTVDKADN